jgi:hypothetical protein
MGYSHCMMRHKRLKIGLKDGMRAKTSINVCLALLAVLTRVNVVKTMG